MLKLSAAVAAALFVAGAASAQITVDGTLDSAYGAAKSVVTYQAGAPTSNFQAPTQYASTVGYSIYLTTDASNVYGFIQAQGQAVGGTPFANLYFDLDPANGNGSDLGFEIANDRAFVPGMNGYSGPLSGISFTASADGTGFEFSIANSLFTSQIAGLTYYNGQQMPAIGDDVVLRLSQSFNYSVAGGESYGDDRLGRVTLGATPEVPEPATWGMMILGFGMIGGLARSRKRTAAHT